MSANANNKSTPSTATTIIANVIFLLTLAIVAAPPSLHAADMNAFVIVGDVASVDIVRVNGIYRETFLNVWAYTPTAPPQPYALRCNGNGGGSLANCLFPSAFLNCTRTRTDSPNLFFPFIVTEHYQCQTPARRDIGECVILDAKVRVMDEFTYSYEDTTMQALSLDVMNVNWTSGCTSKP